MLNLLLLAATLAQTPQPEGCRLTPVTPFQPASRIEEGERAIESQTFQASFGLFALDANNRPHFVDAVNRIRRIDPDGRIRTVAGNGSRADTLDPGTALDKAMPAVTQILFSPAGVLHFNAVNRVWKLEGGRIEPVAGSGRPGFNGESGIATEVNLGGIVNLAFTRSGDLLIVDGFARVRRLPAGSTELRTAAGSTRASVAAGFVGDNGPATEAALSNPRQVFPFADGSYWIRDLGGRQLRIVSPDGIIRTINNNFDTSVNIAPLADGSPAATTANRVYPIRPNGTIETGAAPFRPFTGAPLAIDREATLYFLGNERPELRNPLQRMRPEGTQTSVASAPTVPLVDGQAPPFGVWFARTNSLIYSAAIGGKTGIVEAGQTAKFLVGGGTEIGDPEGKEATAIALFGVTSFAVDNQNRIVLADASRQRILVVGSDNKVSVLKTNDGEPVRFAPLGAFGTHQRITTDAEGNIYWYRQGATPTGGVFTADISAWRRADSSIRVFTVPGLVTMIRLEDGNAGVISGNATNFRSVRRISPDGLGAVVQPFDRLPLTSVVTRQGQPYFTAATRLFRGAPGNIEMLDLQYLPSSAAFNPNFVTIGGEGLLLRLGDSGFYSLPNPDACRWIPQPRITSIASAAGNGAFPNTIAPFQWLTITGTGFGPPEGQDIVLNALARAGAQPAPYPAINIGTFTGTIPVATLTGTALPVITSNDKRTVVQVMATLPLSEYLLYFSWQGLQLIHPQTLRPRAAAPALFVEEDGSALGFGKEKPVERESEIQLLATGLGVHAVPVNLGDFYPLSEPVVGYAAAVEVFIDNEPVEVLAATGVPGGLGGGSRITIRVPANLEPGEHRVRIAVNGFPAADAAPRAILYVK